MDILLYAVNAFPFMKYKSDSTNTFSIYEFSEVHVNIFWDWEISMVVPEIKSQNFLLVNLIFLIILFKISGSQQALT